MKNLFQNFKLKRKIISALAAMHVFGNPSSKLKIVGVTGTNGKTTTTTLLYKVATALGYKVGLIGTVENIIVDKVSPATHTTPDSVFLTKLLKEMVDQGCEYVFMEVSSHALDQNRVAGTTFTGGIFTNLTHDHLDYHKNLDNYFLAKKKFFDMLGKNDFALSNSDDTHGRVILKDTKAKQYFYGFKKKPARPDGRSGGEDFHGEILNINSLGLEMKFNETEIKSKLLGKFNAYNLLSVWSASNLLGFDMEKVNKILENIEPPRGRFEHFTSPIGVMVVVDYAHTPDALEKILLAIHDVRPKDKKIISVFGCGGDRDPMKRSIMGKIGTKLSDIAIFTSDNPRNEDPEKIIEQMKADLSKPALKKVKTIASRREAIAEAVKLASPGDIILCAGKGHEDYQEIKGVKQHFNDKEEFEKLFV